MWSSRTPSARSPSTNPATAATFSEPEPGVLAVAQRAPVSTSSHQGAPTGSATGTWFHRSAEATHRARLRELPARR